MRSSHLVSLAPGHPGGGPLSGAAPTLGFGREATLPATPMCPEPADDEEPVAWTQEEIVMLHGILFDTCVDKLIDPETPLDEVVDWLRWIFSERGKEAQAFSFSNALKLYQRPPARFIREALQHGLRRYLSERLARYPAWVAEAFWSDPDRFANELDRNPQGINEALRRVARSGDLFAA